MGCLVTPNSILTCPRLSAMGHKTGRLSSGTKMLSMMEAGGSVSNKIGVPDLIALSSICLKVSSAILTELEQLRLGSFA